MDLEPDHFVIISALLQICQRWGPRGKVPRRVFTPRDGLTRKTKPSLSCCGFPWKSHGSWWYCQSGVLKIYTAIVCFVFPTNIGDLLGRSQDKLEFCSANVLSEWVTLKAVLKGTRVPLWSSWACDWEPTSYNVLCRKGGWLRFWPFKVCGESLTITSSCGTHELAVAKWLHSSGLGWDVVDMKMSKSRQRDL